MYRAGHQNINWDREKVSDMLNGMSDVIDLGVENKLDKLIEKTIEGLNNELHQFYDICLKDNKLDDYFFEILSGIDNKVKSYFNKFDKYYVKKIAEINISVKVSVIIPIYNSEKYLEEALKSIINQTLFDIEIICIDDGSTDKSRQILNYYATNDTRIVILSQENSGQGVARNEGIKIAKGKYIYFFDSDDILEENALELLYDEAEKDNLDVLYFNGRSFFENTELESDFKHYEKYYTRENMNFKKIVKGFELFNYLSSNGYFRVSPCLQLISKKLIIENKIDFDTTTRVHEDELFSFKIMLKG